MRVGWLVMVAVTLVAILSFPLLVQDAVKALRLPSAYAVSFGPDQAGRVYQNGNNNDNDADGDNDDNVEDGDNIVGDEDGDNGGDGDNVADDEDDDNVADDEDGDNDGDVDDDITAVACSAPDQDTVFTSHDGKLALRVFGSSPSPVRVVIYQVINAHEAPQPPGTFVDPLVYEVWASYCDESPVPEFPAEVNVGIRYNDAEVAGLEASRFVFGRLDMDTATWVPVEKQANDPPANYISATIIQTGYYMVWEAR
jgi:hypothetical protein